MEPKVKQYPLYENPYGNLQVESDTEFELHGVRLGGSELAAYMTSLSPYVAKLEAYFRLFDVNHKVVAEPIPDGGPRGKVPYITVGETRISDSQLIIDWLKRTVSDPDTHLTEEQKAIGHAVKRTLEDHLYWIIIYFEFFDQQGFDFIVSNTLGDTSVLPAEVQEAIRVRRDDFRKRCYDQGIARYTHAEIIDKAKKDFEAISVILGENRFLLGNDAPSSYDATLFGFTQAFFQARGMHPEITDFVRTIPNLGRYIQNIQETWYPELKLAFDPA
jgi:hypothetical protein